MFLAICFSMLAMWDLQFKCSSTIIPRTFTDSTWVLFLPSMGGDLGGLRGRSPKTILEGKGPCILPQYLEKWYDPCIRPLPNIWRSSVIEKKKNGNVVCEIDVFVKKRVIYMCYILEMRYTLSCQTLETGGKNIRNEVYAIMSDSRDRGTE